MTCLGDASPTSLSDADRWAPLVDGSDVDIGTRTTGAGDRDETRRGDRQETFSETSEGKKMKEAMASNRRPTACIVTSSLVGFQ